MDHKCFIFTQEERDKIKKRNVNGEIKNQTKGYIFYDYVSMNEDGLHIPNLIIADKMCFDCIDRWKVNEMRESCVNNCGFFNFNNNNDFCYWLLEQKKFTGFAHNLKAYDGIFIMKYIVDNPLPTDSLPKIVLNGLKQ
jgi:restriction endonuclease S subunit